MTAARIHIILIMAMTFCLVSGFGTAPVLGNGTTVEVNSGTPVVVNEGASQSDIPVTIKDIPNLGAGNGVGAFTFNLKWNTYVVRVDAVNPANISGWAIAAGTPDNNLGRVTVTGFTGSNFLVGNATLFTLKITGISSTQGPGAILVEILDLGDRNGIRIPATPIAGQVQVVKGGSTPAPAPTPAASYTLTIMVNGPGSTTPAAGTYNHPSGTVVNLTAIPAAGAQFTGWTGDVSSPSSPTTQISMNASKTVTANFSSGPATYTLTILASGQGTVTPSVGSHSYPAGTTIELKATAAPGWRFVNWSGEVANPSSATTTITINKNITVTASFVDTSAPVPTPTTPATPTPKPGPGTTTTTPTPTQPPSAAPPSQTSGGLATWQIVLIAVGAVAVVAPVLYFVLRRLITMWTYRV